MILHHVLPKAYARCGTGLRFALALPNVRDIPQAATHQRAPDRLPGHGGGPKPGR